MRSIQTYNIINGIASSVYLSMGIWEWAILSITNINKTDLVNDMAQCFIYTSCIINMIMGCSTIYLLVRYSCLNTHLVERTTINVTSGISIWGIILYNRYAVMFELKQVLLAEMIIFYIKIGLSVFASCCINQPQTNNT
jgi:NADH:ubiquinone oxidoreductase subunit 6 (subunit J)